MASPGYPGVRDALAAVKHNGLPNEYTFIPGASNFANVNAWYQQPSWYASPPDVWGRGAVALDWGGQPLFM